MKAERLRGAVQRKQVTEEKQWECVFATNWKLALRNVLHNEWRTVSHVWVLMMTAALSVALSLLVMGKRFAQIKAWFDSFCSCELTCCVVLRVFLIHSCEIINTDCCWPIGNVMSCLFTADPFIWHQSKSMIARLTLTWLTNLQLSSAPWGDLVCHKKPQSYKVRDTISEKDQPVVIIFPVPAILWTSIPFISLSPVCLSCQQLPWRWFVVIMGY